MSEPLDTLRFDPSAFVVIPHDNFYRLRLVRLSLSLERNIVTLFVCNIRYELTDDDLYQLFVQFGHVKSAHVAVHANGGASRGFGFVCFLDSRDAQTAIESLNGYAWYGRTLHVQEAKTTSRTNMHPAIQETR
jgi:RNA recognition motif-containing protein